MSSYDALAASYDGLMADGVYRRRADYLEKLFQKSRIPVHTVLDLACGTGTIACLLAAKGYAVTATDLSEEMLTQARARRRLWNSRRCLCSSPCPGFVCRSRWMPWCPRWIP